MSTSTRAPGYHPVKEDVLARLRKVEGQVRGISRMVESDTYCIDVLTQVAAASKALQNTALLLLDEHLRHCVAGAASSGDHTELDGLVSEATRAVERLLRS